MNLLKTSLGSLGLLLLVATVGVASEADLQIPDLRKGSFERLGGISAWNLLFYGALVITGTLGISLYLRHQVHILPAHSSMLKIAEIIFATCKTYLIQQGRFLLMLFAIIGTAMAYYFIGLQHDLWTGDNHFARFARGCRLIPEGVPRMRA